MAVENERKWDVQNLSDLASILGVGYETAKAWRRKGMPGRPRGWPLPAILRWLRTEGPWRPEQQGNDGSGAEIAALERWREEKFRLARLEREEREKLLLPRAEVHDGLARMAGVLRTLGDSLQRHFGPAALQLVDEALDDWQRELNQLLGSDGA